VKTRDAKHMMLWVIEHRQGTFEKTQADYGSCPEPA